MAQNGGSRGGAKKGLKLSRLGELLNTQKNVHFLCTRGAPPGGAPGRPKMHPILDPFWGGNNIVFSLLGAPTDPLFGPDFGPIFGPILGPFWRPDAGAPRGGNFRIFRNFRNFRISPPGRDPVLDPLPGGCRRGVTWEGL